MSIEAERDRRKMSVDSRAGDHCCAVELSFASLIPFKQHKEGLYGHQQSFSPASSHQSTNPALVLF